MVRFVIEQYRDELITSLQGSVDEQRVSEDREAVASDLLNILHRCVLACAHTRTQRGDDALTLALRPQHPDPVHRHERALIGEWWACREEGEDLRPSSSGSDVPFVGAAGASASGVNGRVD